MRSQVLLLVLLLSMSWAQLGVAEPPPVRWGQFRGKNATGVEDQARPPVQIGPSTGVLWKVEVPFSPSSPTLWNDRLFLTTFHDGQLETRCHDTDSGRLLWSRQLEPAQIEEYHSTDGSPATSTPAVAAGHVVSYFGSFGLVCHDHEGKELWRIPLPVAESAGRFGTGTSPIIVGDRVVLCRDQHRNSSLLAVDLKTGRKLWETPRPESGGSFGTPVHWQNNSVDEIVVAATGQLKGYDLKTGVERWVVTGVTGYVCTTPVVANGWLYFAAFSNGQKDSPLMPWQNFRDSFDANNDQAVAFDEIGVAARDYYRGLDFDRNGRLTEDDWKIIEQIAQRTENVMVAVKPGGTGDISKTHVAWRHRKGLPYVASPLCYDGTLYLMKDGGLLSALDAENGEVRYGEKRLGPAGPYYASPVAADGRIYAASVAGVVIVLQAGGSQPRILSQADFEERILATPALAGDRLYLRTEKHLYAFGH